MELVLLDLALLELALLELALLELALLHLVLLELALLQLVQPELVRQGQMLFPVQRFSPVTPWLPLPLRHAYRDFESCPLTWIWILVVEF